MFLAPRAISAFPKIEVLKLKLPMTFGKSAINSVLKNHCNIDAKRFETRLTIM